jgi:hypothetical protein
MRLSFMPKARLGKWAVGFGVALVALMVLELIFAIAIGGNPSVIEGSPLLTILAYSFSIAVTLIGPLSFIVGIISIIKNREWLVITLLAVLYALTIGLFILGEALFSH